jgi:5-methyltetrahydrofolate--homocysteine methyltransferase
VGLNCALGADLMRPHIAELARVADTLVSAYPNAGLPNAMGEYDETPTRRATCCTSGPSTAWSTSWAAAAAPRPDHIRHVAEAVRGLKPRVPAERAKAMRLAGLEPFELA